MNEIKQRSILVFALLPGDETFACGGYMALSKANGANVKVVVAAGDEKPSNAPQAGQTRKKECIAGLEILGITDVVFWEYKASALPLSGEILAKYRDEAETFKPDVVLMPSPSETRAEYRRLTRGIVKALEGYWYGSILFYESANPLLVNTAIDITSVIELKRLAIQANIFTTKWFNYEDNCMMLGRLRGLSAGREYAEGFLSYDWDGARQNFFETYPLISVIVRADNLLYLTHALQSLIKQEYDQFEVILVWFGRESPDLKEFDCLDIQCVGGETGRGLNLNIGISHAKGQYISILDQDDIFYPDHLSLLLLCLQGNNAYDIAYSGCKVIHYRMSEGQAVFISEEKNMNSPCQHGRLAFGNYIPIHALLFRNNVFHSLKFDENLTAYEDWDMLYRLEKSGYRFFHIEDITCEYRLFAGSETDTIQKLHEEKGYLTEREKVLSKILCSLDVDDIKQFSGIVEDNEQKLNECTAQISQITKLNAAQKKTIDDYKSIERLIEQGMNAVGIYLSGRSGISTMIGRLIQGELLFSIILPVYNIPPSILSETINSIKNQAFTGWELCLVDDCSDKPETIEFLSVLQEDPFFSGKIHIIRRKKQGGIVEAMNDGIAVATLPYLAFVDHDDLLHEEALLLIALALKTEDYSMIYTDNRLIDLTGKPLNIYHKPAWSPVNLLFSNYINHLLVVRRDIFDKAGGFRKEYEGAQDMDLLLRLSNIVSDTEVRHIKEPLYDWRATQESVAYSGSAKPYSAESARRAVAEHLREKGFHDVNVGMDPKGFGFTCEWRPEIYAIDVVIHAGDSISEIKSCMEGLLEKTDYPNLSITIVSATNKSPDMLHYLDSLSSRGIARITTVPDTSNISACSNKGSEGGTGDIILFLYPDIEIRDKDWLLNMTRYFMLDNIGIVGATIFYPDGSLYSNGMRTGNDFIAEDITTLGERMILSSTKNVSAVNGHCLMLKRETFELAGGFDEQLPRFFNDADLCIAVRKLGLNIVQASDAKIVCRADTNNKIDKADTENQELKTEQAHCAARMRAKWGDYLDEKYMASYEIFAHITRILNMN